MKTAKPKKMLNRDQRELAELPGRIEQLEAERDSCTKKLEDPALYQKGPAAARSLQDEIATLERMLHTNYARWDELEKLRLSLAE